MAEIFHSPLGLDWIGLASEVFRENCLYDVVASITLLILLWGELIWRLLQIEISFLVVFAQFIRLKLQER